MQWSDSVPGAEVITVPDTTHYVQTKPRRRHRRDPRRYFAAWTVATATLTASHADATRPVDKGSGGRLSRTLA